MAKTNIVLIGFSGCGKTTMGEKLAKMRGLDFTDTDVRLEREAGIPITEIFEKFGEEYFRRLEADTIKKTAARGNTVIATGGGCIKSEANMHTLTETGIVVYVKCHARKIYENVKDDTSRPLLQSDDKLKKIEELLNQRIPLYEKYAEISVDISNCGIDEAVSRLSNAIDNYAKR